MSVTISPDTMDLPHTYGVSCHTFGGVIGAADTYEGGQAIRARHLLICSECATWGAYTTAVPTIHADAPEVNLSNSNAARVLRLLGLYDGGEELVGSVEAGDLFSRAGGYLTLVESPAITWDGYLVEKVTALREVAQYAMRAGLRVTWARGGDRAGRFGGWPVIGSP